MIDLRKPETFRHLDPKNVFGSTGLFTAQCQQMLDEYYDKSHYDNEYKNIRNIVFAGMGGSSYGAHITNSVYLWKLSVPVVTINDYHLPGFVNRDSLVFVTSYSGSTEEALSILEEAKKRNAKITALSSGGKLGEGIKKDYPGIIFDPKNNPSGQPRLGTGYMVIGILILLNSLGVISISKDELDRSIEEVESSQEEIKAKAKTLAEETQGYIPLIFACGHLVGNAHIIRNQLNETSKSFSVFEDIPELNHHLMEGLKNPPDKKLKVLFLNSELYTPIHKKRLELTKDIVSKNEIKYIEFIPKGSSKLSQALNTLSFGGFYSLYLSILYGQDPSVIPWVDYFKKQLSKTP